MSELMTELEKVSTDVFLKLLQYVDDHIGSFVLLEDFTANDFTMLSSKMQFLLVDDFLMEYGICVTYDGKKHVVSIPDDDLTLASDEMLDAYVYGFQLIEIDNKEIPKP